MQQLSILFISNENSSHPLVNEIEDMGHEITRVNINYAKSLLIKEKYDLAISLINNRTLINHVLEISNSLILITASSVVNFNDVNTNTPGAITVYYTKTNRNWQILDQFYFNHEEAINIDERLKEFLMDLIVNLARDSSPGCEVSLEKPPVINVPLDSLANNPIETIVASIKSLYGRFGADEIQLYYNFDYLMRANRQTYYHLSNDDLLTNLENESVNFFMVLPTNTGEDNCLSDTFIKVRLEYNAFTISLYTTNSIHQEFLKHLAKLLDVPATKDIATQALAFDKQLIVFSQSKQTNTEDNLVDINTKLEKICTEQPNAIALFHQKSQITYSEFQVKANKISNLITSNIDTAGTKNIVISMDKSPILIATLFAVLKAGYIYVLIDPMAPRERASVIINEVTPDLCLIDETVDKTIFTDNLCIILTDKTITNLSGHFNKVPISTTDSAYICFTSGSTGTPKGVIVSHGAIVNIAQSHQNYIGLKQASRVLAIASIGFDAFGWDIYGALLSGATVYLAENHLHASPVDLHVYCERNQVNHVTITPAILDLFPASSWDQLKSIIVMGDAPTEASVKFWSNATRLINGYGPTEATIATTLGEYHESTAWNCIGKPIDNYRCYILDEHKNPQPIGAVGELFIAGVGLAVGYWNNSTQTHDKFIEVSLADFQRKERLYCTGDLAFWNSDGTINFVGRRDNQVKIRGVRLEIDEIESVLKAHEKVNNTCVITTGILNNKQLIAYVEYDGTLETEKSIKQYLAVKLQPAAIPSAFIQIDKLPLTLNGKTDKKQLPSFNTRKVAATVIRSSNKIESIVESITAAALNLSTVCVEKDLMDIGAHSLTFTKIAVEISAYFSIQFNISYMFEYHTVREVSKFIATLVKENQTDIVKLEKRIAPLTNQQQMLWYLQELNPEGYSYNLPFALDLKGKLNVEAIEKALNFVIAKHESFRTLFKSHRGEPRQEIVDTVTIKITNNLIDCSDESTANELMLAACQTPFVLKDSLPFRVELYRLADDHHILFFVKHNIITDAWSEGLIMIDFSNYYNALISKKPFIPAKDDYQVVDIAQYLNDKNDSEVAKKQAQYWQEKLINLISLDFPLDHSRPTAPKNHGERIRFELNHLPFQSLKDLAIKLKTTPFVLLVSALNILFYQYTRQTDIVIGTAISGRTEKVLQKVSGFFVNTIPLRNSLNQNDNLAEFIKTVHQTCIESYNNQDISFNQIVDHAKAERVTNKNPIFQIMAVLQNADEGTLPSLTGLETSRRLMQTGSVMFDMSWNFFIEQDTLIVDLDYSTEIFKSSTMKRMLDNFNTLLASFIVSKNKSVNTVAYLSNNEIDRLAQFNDKVESNDLGNQSLIDQIYKQACKTPEKIAIHCGEKTLTYAQLWQQSGHLAHHLSSCYDESQNPLGLLMLRSEKVAVSILAILRAKHYYVPIDPRYPADRIEYMITHSGIEHIIIENDLDHIELSTQDHQTINYDDVFKTEQLNEPSVSLPTADELAYVIYTSGSTGKPKGVQITHHNLNNFCHYFVKNIPISAHDRFMSITTISFDIFGLELYTPLMAGAELILCDQETSGNPVDLVNYFNKLQPTVMQATPTMWGAIAHHLSVEGELTVLCGGEAMSQEVLTKLQAIATKVLQVYGPTETTIWSSIAEVTHCCRANCIGSPVANTLFYVLNEAKALAPIGVPGELYIGGDGLSPGYLNAPELTEKAFSEIEFNHKTIRLYKTGDKVKFNHEGLLFYIGRNDFQIKLRGHRIELSEIDAWLAKFSGIKEAVTIIFGSDAQARIISFVVMKPDIEFDDNDVLQYLRDKLPNIMVPSAIIKLDKFPLTDNNKIDIKNLPKQDCLFSIDENKYTQPENEIELQLQAILEEALNLKKISCSENYFNLGGTSLQIPIIISKIHELFKTEMSIRTFILNSTIKKLAVIINELHTEK